MYVNKAAINFIFAELYTTPYMIYRDLIENKNRLKLKVHNIILVSFIPINNIFNATIIYTINISKLNEKNSSLLSKKSPVKYFFSNSQPIIE